VQSIGASGCGGVGSSLHLAPGAIKHSYVGNQAAKDEENEYCERCDNEGLAALVSAIFPRWPVSRIIKHCLRPS
jgi:hypothetical protein